MASTLTTLLAERGSTIQKITGTVISFAVSLGMFVIIRVVGVLYFGDLFQEIIAFDPISALNFIVWIGIASYIAIGFGMINIIVVYDRLKLNMDLISATVLSIGFSWLLGYNFVGYVYPNLIADLTIFDRVFVYGIYWVTIIGVYGFPDLFLFWLLASTVFHVVFFAMSMAEMDLETAFELGKRSRKKSFPEWSRINLTTEQVWKMFGISLIVLFGTLYLTVSIVHPELFAYLFSFEGMMVLIVVSVIWVLFFIVSMRFKNKASLWIYAMVSNALIRCVIYFYVLLWTPVLAICLIIAGVFITQLISSAVI